MQRRDTDEVLGVVHPGEILQQEQQGIGNREWDLKTYVRPAPTIFEHTPLTTLLEDFRTNPAPLAFVRDEYGSVVGIITPAELLSVLAGQMGDMERTTSWASRPLTSRTRPSTDMQAVSPHQIRQHSRCTLAPVFCASASASWQLEFQRQNEASEFMGQP